MTANPAIMPRSASAAELFPISEGDLPTVASFIAHQSGRGTEAVNSHLRWFLLENPARTREHPLGFCLAAGNELVGCILCVPQMFRFQTKQILLMGSSSFYVDEKHRGSGGRIFLNYCRLGKTWPLFGTSANAVAAGLWRAAGAIPIPYCEGELFGILRWPPVMEELAHRWNSNHLLSHLARRSVSKIIEWFRPLKVDDVDPEQLRLLASADEALDLPVHGTAPKLTAERDLPYIRWRYFSGRDATTEAFAFPSRELGKDVLVTVNQRARGYRGQINALNLLDVYPEVTPVEYMCIIAALIARYRKAIDTVVLRGQDRVREELFRASGFHWRQFEAPIGWLLDKSSLLPTRDWYPVPADGDGLI